MGHLVLTRREGEHITIRAVPGTDPHDLLAELLVNGIKLMVTDIGGSQVKLSFDAPLEMKILRSELER